MKGKETLTRLVTSLVSLALAAFWLMLCEGAVARAHGWPTLSYWESVLTVIGLGAVVQYGTLSIHSSTRRAGTR